MDRHITTEQLEGLKAQPEVLVALVMEQARVIAQLQEQVGKLQERLKQLEQQNHPPGGAPFGRKRKDGAKPNPGKPGRRPGHKAEWKRKASQVDEHIEVKLESQCPCCASALEGVMPLDQYVEQIIPAKRHVTHLRTHRGWCPKCEQPVASTHPMQVSEAGGAAGTHLGARALGVACMLKHQMGLSFAKTSEALRELCGITISPGGLAQAYQRVAAKLEGDYEALRAQLLSGASVHTDETGWWVGGRGPRCGCSATGRRRITGWWKAKTGRHFTR